MQHAYAREVLGENIYGEDRDVGFKDVTGGDAATPFDGDAYKKALKEAALMVESKREGRAVYPEDTKRRLWD